VLDSLISSPPIPSPHPPLLSALSRAVTAIYTNLQALAGVPEADRCTCEHKEVPGRSGVWEVPKRAEGESEGKARVDVGYE
jgi:hypothetical protein